MSLQKTSPNFFMIGAPKCGTTAVADWMRKHPEVFVTSPKEPFFLAKELRPMSERLGIRSFSDYESLFSSRKPGQTAIGEASTLYLSSTSARESIVEQYPDARFIVFLRNPIEIAQAFHMQAVFAGYEDCGDFETAWQLQEERKQGQQIPAACPVDRLLFYEDVAAVGEQVQNWIDVVGPERIQIFTLDELRENPVRVAAELERFLEVGPCATSKIEKANDAMVCRNRLLLNLVRSKLFQVSARKIQGHVPRFVWDYAKAISLKLTRVKRSRKQIDEDFQSALVGKLSPQVSILEDALRRPLPELRESNSRGEATRRAN